MDTQTTQKLLLALLIVGLAAGLYVWRVVLPGAERTQTDIMVNTENELTNTGETDAPESALPVATLVEGLEIPWDIAFLPDRTMLVTERPGRVVHIESGQIFPIEGVRHIGEGGLLGIALHPQFSENNFVYLYQTTDEDGGLRNRIVRYTYADNAFTFDRIIFDDIPGARYHDGGRIAFGPDGMLYVAVGDATDEDEAQNPDSLAGSILRMTPEGGVPEGNPFGTLVYSYGHRNPQGIAWDDRGRLWSTEHGRSVIRSGFDEINLIVAGGNYGWPDSEGDTVEAGTIAPALHSTASVTWAPASALYHEGSLFFGGLKGETLYEAVLSDDEVVELREHFVGEFGRIRTVVKGPDGMLYLTTSNRDGRGDPRSGDDKIIRINPAALLQR